MESVGLTPTQCVPATNLAQELEAAEAANLPPTAPPAPQSQPAEEDATAVASGSGDGTGAAVAKVAEGPVLPAEEIAKQDAAAKDEDDEGCVLQ